MVVITTDAAHGMITARRTIRRPGNALFRIWARPSEMRTVAATTTTTQTIVRAKIGQK